MSPTGVCVCAWVCADVLICMYAFIYPDCFPKRRENKSTGGLFQRQSMEDLFSRVPVALGFVAAEVDLHKASEIKTDNGASFTPPLQETPGSVRGTVAVVLRLCVCVCVCAARGM